MHGQNGLTFLSADQKSKMMASQLFLQINIVYVLYNVNVFIHSIHVLLYNVIDD